MTTRKRTRCGMAVLALSLAPIIGGCGSDGAGKPVTPENSVVARPPQTRGGGDATNVAPRPGMAPGQPGAVGPGAPGGAGGR